MPHEGDVNFSQWDDSVLVSKIAKRDSDALSELFARHQDLVFSSASYLVNDDALAEEITLTVFMNVWEQAERYDGNRAKVTTWLLMLTRHRSIDALRRKSVREKSRQALLADTQTLQGNPGVESIVEENLQIERLRDALKDLPADQAKALSLAFLGGYTHREIAEHLKEPIGTVKTRIRLALRKLRDVLDQEDRPADEI
jgi:RNA polymerase sigma-70 factor (ECF subfamily)